MQRCRKGVGRPVRIPGAMTRLSRRSVSNVVFGCVAAACVALWVALALAFAGVLPIIAEPHVAESGETPPLSASAATTAETVETPKPTAPAAQKRTPEAPPTAVVVMTAVRGDSWFSARLGSEEGRVLDERILSQGESVRLEGARIWLSVGAAGNVELTVDGKPRPLSPGTVSVVLTGAQPTARET